MDPIFYILLLLIPLMTTPSPIINIISSKHMNPIKILFSGIIATEKYIITTKYPFAFYVKSELCALPIASFRVPSERYIQEYCVNIAQAHYPNASEVALLDLERPITFFPKLNAAQIPLVTEATIKNYPRLLHNCTLFCNEHDKYGLVTRRHTNRVNIAAGAVGGSTMSVDLEKPDALCVLDSGMPLICDAAVIGLFMFAFKSDSFCCVMSCSSFQYNLTVVKLYSEDVQKLLRRYIRDT